MCILHFACRFLRLALAIMMHYDDLSAEAGGWGGGGRGRGKEGGVGKRGGGVGIEAGQSDIRMSGVLICAWAQCEGAKK